MNNPGISQTMVNVLERINTGIVILDRNSDICYTNDAAVGILKITLSDMIDKKLSDLFCDESLLSAIQTIRSGITEKSILETNVSGRVIKITVEILTESRFGVGALLLIVEDVTSFRELDHVKTEFIETLLHRLRTPLTTIKSCFSILSYEKTTACENYLDIFDMCLSETNRLVFFLNDLRDLFLIESGLIAKTITRKLIPLDPVLKKAVQTIELECREKSIQIKYDDLSNSAILEGDEDRLLQAVTNVLVNAATFTPQGGRISLSIIEEDDVIRLSIVDTGIGISDEELKQIFDKYYRADNPTTRNVTGYGLGLYISKHLVELLHGRIYAYSQKGKGSQFDLVFPQ
jgi:two-component system, OmpR family, phosphate regulon sensor histidine kinase PhoR